MEAEATTSDFKPDWFHMGILSRLSILLVIIMFTLISLCISVYTSKASGCLSSAGDTAVRSCEKELQQNPDNIAVRLALVDGLIQQHNYKTAAKVLRDGLAIDPENQEFKKRLRMTEGFLDEQTWVEIQRAKQPFSQGGKIDSKVRADKILCTKLKGERALKACNAALESLPNDPELQRGKADALLSLGRTSEANSAYQLEKSMKGDQKKLRIQVKQTKIKFSVDITNLNRDGDKCFQLDGVAGIQACEAALLGNTADKFDVWQRQGELLLATNNKIAALQAFQKAEKLQPSNMAIKEKIASLSHAKKKVEQKETPKKIVAPVDPTEAIVTPLEPQEENAELKIPQNIIKRYSNAPLGKDVTY